VGNVLLEAREIEIMRASEVFESSWEIFSNQEDSGLSFVDASNLACMEMRGIRKIATFDKDFLGRSEVVVGEVYAVLYEAAT
jgi:predicted nucleic acid-binding protein